MANRATVMGLWNMACLSGVRMPSPSCSGWNVLRSPVQNSCVTIGGRKAMSCSLSAIPRLKSAVTSSCGSGSGFSSWM